MKVRTPLCPAGHLPLKGGDRFGAPSQSYLILSVLSDVNTSASSGFRSERVAILPISPLEGEMSGRTEGGKAPTLTLYFFKAFNSDNLKYMRANIVHSIEHFIIGEADDPPAECNQRGVPVVIPLNLLVQ